MGLQKHASMHMIGVLLLLPVLINIATGQMRLLQNISDIRLVNGIGLYDGRVELLVNGTWGTICGTSFDLRDARAICNILFGSGSFETYHTTSEYYGAGTGPIYIDNLDCKGRETDINECTYSLDVSCTYHNRDVAVACYGPPWNITNTRLVNGTGPYDGRIEVYMDGHWGTISSESVNMYAAQTICNTHGASLAMYFDTAIYGEGSGPMLIGRIDCYRGHDTIHSCILEAPYRPYSSHRYDLSIVCTPCGLPDIYNGDPVAFNGTELTVSCHTGFHPNQVKMKCLTGNVWSQNQRCTPNHVFPLNITDIRITNKYNVHLKGRVEIKVNGTWGTICDTDFDVQDASVICKMFGLQYGTHYRQAWKRHGRGSGPIYMDKLDCDGTESHINMCNYQISNNCTHYDDVAVVCQGVSFPLLDITGVRLTDGPSPTSGRVELKYLDTWGTVCDDSFDIQEASAICSMLGYPPAVTFYPGANYGQGSGPIFVDDLSCKGDATHINNCTYTTDGNCDHREDVSVVCTDCGDPTPENGSVNSTKSHYGATVHVTCDKGYSLIGDSDIICQINGTWSNIPTCKLTHVDCGNPKPVNGNINTTSTVHTTVATVWCNDGYTLIGDSVITCQTNESWTSYPTCELIDCRYPKPKFADVTLLDDKTTFGETAVISCWPGYIPVINTSVSCLAGGTWEEWPECEIVDCGNPVPLKGSANSSETTYKTALEITCDVGYILAGLSTITCQANGTWTDSPVCDKADCGDPKPVNGNINTTSTVHTTVATVWCNDGYTLTGDSVITCQSNEAWTSYPTCELIDCRYPKPKFADVTLLDDKTTFGETAVISCWPGYIPVINTSVSCLAGGTWEKWPECEIVDCGNPVPLKGSANNSETTYKTALKITCDVGYILAGLSTITCQANGTWTDSPVCDKADCGDPKPVNGNINTTSTVHTTVATVWCNDGYTLIGDSVITCQSNEAWTSYPTCELTDCRYPNPKFADVTLLDDKTTFGETAVISCWPGYIPINNTSVSCLAGGTWEEWPECEIVDCGNPVPLTGSANSSETTYKTALEITCDVGYILAGLSTITCQANGTWTDSPVCDKADCSTKTNCSDCKSGYWGEACQLSCPPNCRSLTCEKQSGDCYLPCALGYWGTKCNLSCPTNCKFGTCNRTTGDCDDGCEINYYGGQCNMTCAATCLPLDDGRRCFYANGSCVNDCQNGYYGDTCQGRCSENCINIVCSRASGACKFGCVGGFEGNDCTKPSSEVMSDSGNTADTSNVGLFIGVGVGAVAATLLAVGIVIIIRRHLRHEQVRRRTPENTHELTDVQQRNIRIVQESPNIRIVQESPNIPTLAECVNTPPHIYEELQERNTDSDMYGRINDRT